MISKELRMRYGLKRNKIRLEIRERGYVEVDVNVDLSGYMTREQRTFFRTMPIVSISDDVGPSVLGTIKKLQPWRYE